MNEKRTRINCLVELITKQYNIQEVAWLFLTACGQIYSEKNDVEIYSLARKRAS